MGVEQILRDAPAGLSEEFRIEFLNVGVVVGLPNRAFLIDRVEDVRAFLAVSVEDIRGFLAG